MKVSTKVDTLVLAVKHMGQELVVLCLFVLLILLGLLGTGLISHAPQVGVPTGGLMAPNPGNGDPVPPPPMAGTNGDIHIGGMATTNGTIRIGG